MELKGGPWRAVQIQSHQAELHWKWDRDAEGRNNVLKDVPKMFKHEGLVDASGSFMLFHHASEYRNAGIGRHAGFWCERVYYIAEIPSYPACPDMNHEIPELVFRNGAGALGLAQNGCPGR